MKYWLFQTTPKHINLIEALRSGKFRTWDLGKHKNTVSRGDKVILYFTGDKAGIYGLATVESNPGNFPASESEKQFWKAPTPGETNDVRIELHIDQNLCDRPLRLDEIRSIDALQDLNYGTQGKTFTVTEDQFKAVESAINERTTLNSTVRENGVEPATAKPPFDDRIKYPSKNIILFGPPGTGKTYKLKDYEKDFCGEHSENEAKRWEFITFHQSYSYEDFIEGIKPKIIEGIDRSEPEEKDNQLAYEVRPGLFKALAERAKKDPSRNYALFIDEINRGNVASIFGELITLIEEDKRLGEENAITVKLPYSHNENEEFGVPQNLYIIGTMNTADRSVEALDTALRRRFSFIEMTPKYDLKVLKEALDKLGINLNDLLQTINGRIERLLDRDHCIGHSYFIRVKNLDGLRCAFANHIIPLLKEYFYGSPEKVSMVLGEAFVEGRKEPTHFAKGEWGDDELDEKKAYVFKDVSKLEAKDFVSIYA